MTTLESRVSRYVEALEKTTRELGYNVVSVSTLNKVIEQYMLKHRPPSAPSDQTTLAVRPFSREELREKFESILQTKLTAQSQVTEPTRPNDPVPDNVVPFRKKA